jgi:hypothetical protein
VFHLLDSTVIEEDASRIHVQGEQVPEAVLKFTNG